MLLEGNAWVFGANINTDLIFPKTQFRAQYAPGEMASHLMSGVDEGFAARVQPGDFIVGSDNFGCGSSREEAAAAMREAGISAVIAPGFGRWFTRNAINRGLPVLELPGIDRQIRQGDRLRVDLDAGLLENVTTGYRASLPAMAPELLTLIRDGGIAAYVRRVLDAQKTA